MLHWVLVLGLLTSPAPLRLSVVSGSEDAALVETAASLRAALATDARLAIAGPVIVPRRASSEDHEQIQQALESIDAAKEHYTNLEPQQALERTAQAAGWLRVWLDHRDARPALARALRLRGLTQLFVQKSSEATRTFASAAFLDPEFSPAVEEWPPEARLAYADTVATARRAATGALSVRVSPEMAAVWLDSRLIGLGSTTVSEVEPGEHFVLVTCPGYQRFAGVVEVEGAGKLAQASVYLEPEGEASEQVAVAVLAAELGSPREATVTRQVAGVLEADAVVVVAADAGHTNGAPVAWVFDASGQRRGSSVRIESAGTAARDVAARLFDVSRSVVVEPATPWYQEWWIWAAAGGAAVVSSSVLAYLLMRDDPDRVTFVVGRQPR